MAHSEEIDKALAAHAKWKERLAGALESGRSDFTAGKVRADDACDFGKWLYGLPATMRDKPPGSDVRALHAAFHQEAAKVLDLALRGRKAEAGAALDPMGPYAVASGRLSLALKRWKQEQG